VAVVGALALTAGAGLAEASAPAAWAAAPGWEVFMSKGCVSCHRVRGIGDGTRGPDLARPQAGTDLFSLGAAMWNHLPKMGAAMRELHVRRQQMSPVEMASLASFLFTVQRYDAPGDAENGRRLFVAKSCAQCHAPTGGSAEGPAVAGFAPLSSPVLLAAAMWNHGPAVAETMAARGIEPPALSAAELADLVAYITASADRQARQAASVIAGSPKRGEELFGAKGCAACHAVAGAESPTAAPRLGRQADHVSVTEFASRLWNHRSRVQASMQQRGLPLPSLTAQQMVDITAYLHTVHYFDPEAGRANRGEELVGSKGCLGCHAVYGRGAKTASDLAVSNVVSSPPGQVAAMWNHGRFMETAARRKLTALPRLTGQDVADIASYLAGLGSGAPKPR